MRRRQSRSEAAISEGYVRFKKEKDGAELGELATKHGLAVSALQAFVEGVLQRLIRKDCRHFPGTALARAFACFPM